VLKSIADTRTNTLLQKYRRYRYLKRIADTKVSPILTILAKPTEQEMSDDEIVKDVTCEADNSDEVADDKKRMKNWTLHYHHHHFHHFVMHSKQ
jgi:hypothetical protein